MGIQVIDSDMMAIKNTVSELYRLSRPASSAAGFSELGLLKGSFQVSKAVAERVMSVPMHPYLS